SVQLQLPRFAVEKDQIHLPALVHNSTDKPQAVTLTWTLDGAAPATGSPTTATNTITLPSHSSKIEHLPATFATVGRATVTLSAKSDAGDDAERRTFPVLPLGRPAEVRLSGQLDRERAVTLPAEFVPNDVSI